MGVAWGRSSRGWTSSKAQWTADGAGASSFRWHGLQMGTCWWPQGSIVSAGSPQLPQFRLARRRWRCCSARWDRSSAVGGSKVHPL